MVHRFCFRNTFRKEQKQTHNLKIIFFQLLSDYNWSEKNELDVLFYLDCPKSAGIIGGQTQYVAIDEEIQDAIITIEPEENVLNIVFRDTARLTKYVSKRTITNCFYLLICSYSE